MLKLFTRDVSASNVYRKIVPNCWSRNTKTAAAKTRQRARDDDVNILTCFCALMWGLVYLRWCDSIPVRHSSHRDSLIFSLNFCLVLNISLFHIRFGSTSHFNMMTLKFAVLWCGVLGCRAAFCWSNWLRICILWWGSYQRYQKTSSLDD